MVKVAYDYFKSKSGEVLGGNTIFTISGTVTVEDGGLSGSSVMTKLKSIRDMGKQSTCVPVNIPGFFNGQGRISNVSIEQGPDPTWVNQGGYSIEVRTPIENLPPNSLGITKDDCVTDLSISESIEIGEESHGIIIDSMGSSFVKFTNKISVTCKPLCSSSGTPFSKALGVVKRLIKIGPQNDIFSEYKNWKICLQDRTLEMSSEGSLNFSSTIIMLPPTTTHLALVNLSFGSSRSYDSETQTKTISGTITGLAPISWSDLVNLGDTCSASKIANADAALSEIKGRYRDVSSWDGMDLLLTRTANCPETSTNIPTGQCGNSTQPQVGCLEPSNSTISKNRTEGSINFSFEWASTESGQCASEGNKTEVIIDVDDPQPTLVEHSIIGHGTSIQNINCKTAKRVSGTLTITSQGGGCPSPANCSSGSDNLMEQINQHTGDGTYYTIGHTETQTLNSYSLKIDLIKGC
jgi:hypothetical protein